MVTLLSQLSECIDFFTTGPKRETLALHLAKNDTNLKDLKKILIKPSDTRWTQRDLSWARAVVGNPVMVKALRIIVGVERFDDYEVEFDVSTRGRARLILQTMESALFVVGKL